MIYQPPLLDLLPEWVADQICSQGLENTKATLESRTSSEPIFVNYLTVINGALNLVNNCSGRIGYMSVGFGSIG